MQVAKAAVGAGELAQQQGAAVAEPWDEAAELVAGVRLGDGRAPSGSEVPTRRPIPSGERSQSASSPSSAASGSLSASSCGAGGSCAFQRTASSGSSRA